MRKCTSKEEGVEGLTEQGELRVHQRPVMKLVQKAEQDQPLQIGSQLPLPVCAPFPPPLHTRRGQLGHFCHRDEQGRDAGGAGETSSLQSRRQLYKTPSVQVTVSHLFYLHLPRSFLHSQLFLSIMMWPFCRSRATLAHTASRLQHHSEHALQRHLHPSQRGASAHVP